MVLLGTAIFKFGILGSSETYKHKARKNFFWKNYFQGQLERTVTQSLSKKKKKKKLRAICSRKSEIETTGNHRQKNPLECLSNSESQEILVFSDFVIKNSSCGGNMLI